MQLPETMKALKLYAPGDIRFETVPLADIKPNEALVNVKACGVCGSDIPRLLTHGAHRAELIPGHEFSGVVVAVGDDVDTVAPGQRIVAAPLIPCMECEWCNKGHYSLCVKYDYLGSRSDGAMAEYVRVPKANLIPLPDVVSFEAGAMVDPAANAVHALDKADITEDSTVVIMGCGPIGLFAVQLARHLGAKIVIGVDVDDKKLDIAKVAGCSHVINSRNEDPIEAIKTITNGGADVLLDASGVAIAQHQAILAAANHGTIIFLGISHDSLELSEKAVDRILRGELLIKGSWNSFSNPFPGHEWTQSVDLMQKGVFFDPSFISHRLRLEEGPEFFANLAKERFYFNKIMFLP
ncbi:galactitol-1-phosphate 5-dehydrogenase [Desulfovibrio inopinatus]|uniref:galactitol-1-phosphate 5-dehydrogenase n=1 Tax=Desulfovibrio inopinatus TaxID=102109 RepID=UPI0004216A47|nr:galactitol-1-phosphate 5-dehydrogenase [Desulfovibrio inopinatus]